MATWASMRPVAVVTTHSLYDIETVVIAMPDSYGVIEILTSFRFGQVQIMIDLKIRGCGLSEGGQRGKSTGG